MKSTHEYPDPDHSEEHRIHGNQRPQKYPWSNQLRVDALQERVALLEKELVQTRLELACAKCSDDDPKLKLAKMSSALVKAMVSSSNPLPSEHDAGAGGTKKTQENARPRIDTVPTVNPFSRKKRRTSALNPGSCTSALNLMALGSQGSMPTLHHAISRTVLDPSSCELDLSLLGLSMSSVESSSQLPLDQDTGGSLSSSTSKAVSLLNRPRLLSNSSFSRLYNKKRRHNSRNILGSSNRNENWAHFD